MIWINYYSILHLQVTKNSNGAILTVFLRLYYMIWLGKTLKIGILRAKKLFYLFPQNLAPLHPSKSIKSQIGEFFSWFFYPWSSFIPGHLNKILKNILYFIPYSNSFWIELCHFDCGCNAYRSELQVYLQWCFLIWGICTMCIYQL